MQVAIGRLGGGDHRCKLDQETPGINITRLPIVPAKRLHGDSSPRDKCKTGDVLRLFQQRLGLVEVPLCQLEIRRNELEET